MLLGNEVVNLIICISKKVMISAITAALMEIFVQ